MMDLRQRISDMPEKAFSLDGVSIRPIGCEEDLWYATAECRLAPGQEEFVNPAGFDIGRAWLCPAENVPCIIRAEGKPIGFITLRFREKPKPHLGWGYYLDARWQGKGWGRTAARLAVSILKAADRGLAIRLSVEADNLPSQRLCASLGFRRTEELDGDDLVYLL